jgi:hypothetical protein
MIVIEKQTFKIFKKAVIPAKAGIQSLKKNGFRLTICRNDNLRGFSGKSNHWNRVRHE